MFARGLEFDDPRVEVGCDPRSFTMGRLDLGELAAPRDRRPDGAEAELARVEVVAVGESVRLGLRLSENGMCLCAPLLECADVVVGSAEIGLGACGKALEVGQPLARLAALAKARRLVGHGGRKAIRHSPAEVGDGVESGRGQGVVQSPSEIEEPLFGALHASAVAFEGPGVGDDRHRSACGSKPTEVTLVLIGVGPVSGESLPQFVALGEPLPEVEGTLVSVGCGLGRTAEFDDLLLVVRELGAQRGHGGGDGVDVGFDGLLGELL